jgi:hypothetical protein
VSGRRVLVLTSSGFSTPRASNPKSKRSHTRRSMAPKQPQNAGSGSFRGKRVEGGISDDIGFRAPHATQSSGRGVRRGGRGASPRAGAAREQDTWVPPARLDPDLASSLGSQLWAGVRKFLTPEELHFLDSLRPPKVSADQDGDGEPISS